MHCKPRWIKAEGTSTGNSLAPQLKSHLANNGQNARHLNSIGILRAFFMAALHGRRNGETRLAGPSLRRYRQGGARRERIRIRHPGVTRGLVGTDLGEKLKVGYKINDSLVINDEMRHIHRHYLRIRGDKP